MLDKPQLRSNLYSKRKIDQYVVNVSDEHPLELSHNHCDTRMIGPDEKSGSAYGISSETSLILQELAALRKQSEKSQKEVEELRNMINTQKEQQASTGLRIIPGIASSSRIQVSFR